MFIPNKEEYKEIPITVLKLSVRADNCLKRNNIFSLYSLIEEYETLTNMRNLGTKSLSEINDRLMNIEKYIGLNENVVSIEENEKSSFKTEDDHAAYHEGHATNSNTADEDYDGVSEEIRSLPVEKLHITHRIYNCFRIAGIRTIGQVLSMSEEDLASLRNMGTLSMGLLLEELKLLREQGENYFYGEETENNSEDEEAEGDSVLAGNGECKYDKRELDIDTVKKLQNDYGFKTIWLCEWYGVSRHTYIRNFHSGGIVADGAGKSFFRKSVLP